VGLDFGLLGDGSERVDVLELAEQFERVEPFRLRERRDLGQPAQQLIDGQCTISPRGDTNSGSNNAGICLQGMRE